MIAFDTDILTEILMGAPKFVTRASSIPPRIRRRRGSQSSQLVCVQRTGLPLRLFLLRMPGGGYQLRLSVLEGPIPSQLIPQVFEILAEMFYDLIVDTFW